MLLTTMLSGAGVTKGMLERMYFRAACVLLLKWKKREILAM